MFLRLFTLVMAAALFVVQIVPRRQRGDEPQDVLITGTFYSDQWLTTHLVPLAQSGRVGHILMVADRPVPAMEGVSAAYPPPALVRAVGGVAARTLLFAWLGLTRRYQVIGGFHLLLNGMVAAIVARLTRARSLYICGGGPREVQGGGFETENKLYGKLDGPDPFIESLLLAFVRRIDLTICMGETAVDYFQGRGVQRTLAIIPGGFPGEVFHPGDTAPEFDFILVGRLSAVKRVDLFIDVIGKVVASVPTARAVIVGDGPDREALVAQVTNLGLGDAVYFAGWQNNVADWLRRSKVFVLTSESEGLSQALLQAMMCGLPSVVSNVGDLKDCIAHKENGFLVDTLDVDAFAEPFLELLENPSTYDRMRANAIRTGAAYETGTVAEAWDKVL